MKTLYILRHAKSSWDFPELSDHDRPLSERGRNDAALMGEMLAMKGVKLHLIISSPAVRALTTATLVGKELGYEPDHIAVDERAYAADRNDLLKIVQAAPASADSLMLVAHNEALSDFADMLAPEPVGSLPTAGIIGLHFTCGSWDEISKENATLLFYDFPKNHK